MAPSMRPTKSTPVGDQLMSDIVWFARLHKNWQWCVVHEFCENGGTPCWHPFLGVWWLWKTSHNSFLNNQSLHIVRPCTVLSQYLYILPSLEGGWTPTAHTIGVTCAPHCRRTLPSCQQGPQPSWINAMHALPMCDTWHSSMHAGWWLHYITCSRV